MMSFYIWFIESQILESRLIFKEFPLQTPESSFGSPLVRFQVGEASIYKYH